MPEDSLSHTVPQCRLAALQGRAAGNIHIVALGKLSS